MSNEDDLKARWAPTLHQVPGYFSIPIPDLTPADINWTVADDQGDEDQDDEDEPKHTGIMVALYPNPAVAAQLAIEDGEPAGDLHITLAYLGDVGEDVPEDKHDALLSVVTAWAAGQDPIDAIINGVGIFSTPEPVTYANIDSPQLPDLHQSLHAVLHAAGFAPNAEHGFTPHMTLIYGDRRDLELPALGLHFDDVVLAWAGQQVHLPFSRTMTEVGAHRHVGGGDLRVYDDGRSWVKAAPSYGDPVQVRDRPLEPSMSMPIPEPLGPSGEQGRAFVTNVHGRTLITAPATAAMKEPSVEDIAAEHMLWMHGRFVGAEVPNRNGALWSAGDLEMAKGTVTNGPLNWLHNAKHVIGTLAKADYVDPREKAGAGIAEPHITATAAIWKWIYPDEAYVIQQASEQEMLWYSMECISKEVACAGENGCGNTVSYSEYMAGAACEHIVQRASVRRFVNPVFLGGAVIVPPTRPGWAEADARVMSTATNLAEAAFEQAGQPNLSAGRWEQVMAQVVAYASH